MTTLLDVPISNLPESLQGLRILQFSDLHINDNLPQSTLKNLTKKINTASPDMIVFTGDFLCYSKLKDKNRLKTFLNTLNAPLGCYAIFGNHDYSECVTINKEGHYDVLDDKSNQLLKGFLRIFNTIPKERTITDRARAIDMHEELVQLLQDTPFQLLDNSTKLIQVGDSKLNCCGLGEYMIGRCLPEQAFKTYDERYPGIILAHNPDSVPKLFDYPGEVILCGHTHGAQINLPWLWKKFVLLENMKYKRGLIREKGKWIYVNRGIGSTLSFRFFSVPEILLLTLRKK
jgi:predicted MPP superfamily phosphohydrolase